MSEDVSDKISSVDRRVSNLEDRLRRLEGLLVLLAQKFGATGQEIGTVMGIDRSQVSRNYPSSDVKRAKVELEDDGGG